MNSAALYNEQRCCVDDVKETGCLNGCIKVPLVVVLVGFLGCECGAGGE